MTTQEISAMIDEMGYSNAYYQWPVSKAPALPYVLFYYPNRADFHADGKIYKKISALNIEFYSDNKDFDGENKIEAVLDEYGLIYAKNESYIDSEKMFLVLYETEVLIDG